MISFKDFCNEDQKVVDTASKDILNAIEKIDDNMHVEDFAKSIAKILIEQYGSHNYTKFLSVLKTELDKDTEENKKAISEVIINKRIIKDTDVYQIMANNFGVSEGDKIFDSNDNEIKNSALLSYLHNQFMSYVKKDGTKYILSTIDKDTNEIKEIMITTKELDIINTL
ncbi:MAG: hypothetical protein PHF21_05310 [Bacilli bacterium]|nr:hypothetical protein [Bacilli bacterium]